MLPFAEFLNSHGLRLGLWTWRGVHRGAVEHKLKVKGTHYTIDQIVDQNSDGTPWWVAIAPFPLPLIFPYKSEQSLSAQHGGPLPWCLPMDADSRRQCQPPGSAAVRTNTSDTVGEISAWTQMLISLSILSTSLRLSVLQRERCTLARYYDSLYELFASWKVPSPRSRHLFG